MMEGSKVAGFCKSLARCRFAMFCYCLLAFLPVVDILSDLLTVANFATNEHPWWAGITLGIFYLSGRFTVLFMMICPNPSAGKLLCLYIPFLWMKAGNDSKLKKMVRNRFIDHFDCYFEVTGDIMDPCFDCTDSLKYSSWCLVRRVLRWLLFIPIFFISWLLVVEIAVFPFACLAIIPITITSCSLSGSYLRAALGRDGSGATVTGGGSSGGSDATADAEIRKKAELFLKTVSIGEAFFESLPQLVLQVRAGLYGDELDDWVFIFTFSVSAISIAKAIATFVWNRGEIREALLDLQEELEGQRS